jgi:nicotinamide-nucleotide amidase
VALRVALVSTGHEVLRGDTLNTNAAWLARRATEAGATVVWATTVGDAVGDIEAALRDAIGRADEVLVTGGLGPTEDDRTRAALARAAGVPVAHDDRAWAIVLARFARAGRVPDERQRPQAALPVGSEPLGNEFGTAPGVRLAVGSTTVALLPGPPREMRAMFEAEVLPRWRADGRIEEAAARVVRTAGLPESDLASRIDDLMRAPEPVVGTHPDEGEVAVRVLARGKGAGARADGVRDEVARRLGAHVVSFEEEERVEHAVVRALLARGEVVATAESVTGGLVARMLVRVAGASGAFRGGFVAYSDAWKHGVLGVEDALLLEHGAVSEPVALAMAHAARERGGCAWGVATTGVAGPGPGMRGVAEGTVFVAVCGHDVETARRHVFGPPRLAVQRRAAVAALDLLRRELASASSPPAPREG